MGPCARSPPCSMRLEPSLAKGYCTDSVCSRGLHFLGTGILLKLAVEAPSCHHLSMSLVMRSRLARLHSLLLDGWVDSKCVSIQIVLLMQTLGKFGGVGVGCCQSVATYF